MKIGPLGEQKRKTFRSKLQNNGLFGLVAQEYRNPKDQTKTKKGEGLKTPFCLNNNRLILVNVRLCNLHPFFFTENNRKSAFSKTQFFCITDSNSPFDTHSNNPRFGRRHAFLEVPRFTILPIFVVFLVVLNTPKYRKWPKQLCALKTPLSSKS